MGWLIENVFKTPSPDDSASRKNNTDYQWISRVAKAVCAVGEDQKTGRQLRSEEIANICAQKQIYATVARGETDVTTQMVGTILGRTFADSPDKNKITVDGYTVVRTNIEIDRGGKGFRDAAYYCFYPEGSGIIPQAPPVAQVPKGTPKKSVPTRFSFAPIEENILNMILQASASIHGPTYEELVASLAQDNIPDELVVRGLSVLVQDERMFQAEGRFFPKASDGFPLVEPKDMELVEKMVFKNPSKLAEWRSYQDWKQGKLPKNAPRQTLYAMMLTSGTSERDDYGYEGFWQQGELDQQGELGELGEPPSNPRLERLIDLAKSPIPRSLKTNSK